MKAIEGVELPSIAQAAQAKLKAAQTEKLTTTLMKMYEERDTLAVQITKDEQALDKKRKQLEEHNKKITAVEGGNWDVIKDDSQQKPQVSGDGKGGGENKGGEGKRPDQRPDAS